ncbi:MAG: peptidase MA family metallohydrolase, partial [Anaerolineaceae bacterium]|nr:peptidase MA family metallohydrolase [Anaerolineaceae bacterium]
MKKLAAILVLCLMFSYGFVGIQSTSASVAQNDAELNFPENIVFSLDLKTADNVAQVKLHYGTIRDACGTVSALAYPEFTTGSSINALWEWNMLQSGGEPPGTTIWWQWEYIDQQGKSGFTDRKEILWLDDIHDWKLLEDGLIRFHYYENDIEYATTLKDAAVEALNHLHQDIGMLPDQPVDLYIYSSTQDMLDAVFYVPGWTGGLAYPDYNILIIGIDPDNLEWGQNTEAHELTHVLVGDYTFSCLGSTPTWLSEGLAVYGEGGASSIEAAFFEQNVKADTLMSFSVLSGGFSEDPDIADLSYSQSFFMVDYLIQTYGKDKMLSLLQRIKAGDAIDEA